MRAPGEATQRVEAAQDAMEKAALAQLRAQWGRTKPVDNENGRHGRANLSIEASRPVQQVVVTKIVEEGQK